MVVTMDDKHSEAMRREAKSNPNGWVYEIDWPYADDDFVPPEAIKGAWKVDGSGTITTEFQENADYRPVHKAAWSPNS